VYALKFIKKQTNKLCIMAIKQDPYALRFIRKHSAKLCIMAIKQDPNTLWVVHRQSFEICLEVVKNEQVRNNTKLRDKLVNHYIKSARIRERIQKVIEELTND